MSVTKETELRSPGQNSGPSFTGGLHVADDSANRFRNVVVGNPAMCSQNLSVEPLRPAGLHGPQTGPGSLNNKVKTALYTFYDFPFKFLFKQFQRVANCYFLMITCLQTVKSVSITHGKVSRSSIGSWGRRQ